MTHQAEPTSVTLPQDLRAGSVARRFLTEAGCLEHHAAVIKQANLLVTELVTNAVRHGAPPITLEVTCTESTEMRVRVSDGSVQQPQLKNTAPSQAGGGRGLMLVDLISDA